MRQAGAARGFRIGFSTRSVTEVITDASYFVNI